MSRDQRQAGLRHKPSSFKGFGKYRKKPIEIIAAQLTSSNARNVMDWITDGGGAAWFHVTPSGLLTFTVKTLEGNMIAGAGDYVIRGIEGEFYPCRQSIFEATYEALR